MKHWDVWVRYWIPGWPGLPSVGDPRTADSLIALAFGRNSFRDEDLPTIARLHRSYHEDDRQTIAFLRSLPTDVGQPNRDLAGLTQRAVDRYVSADGRAGPILLQWEIAVALDPDWYAAHQEHVYALWPWAGRTSFTTLDVLRLACEFLQEAAFRRPILVAHDWQIARAFLVMRRLSGQAPIIVGSGVRSFDAQSQQWWTRHPFRWLPRETYGRWIHHPAHRLVF